MNDAERTMSESQDIVEQLRAEYSYNGHSKLNEAADEIERLRGALRDTVEFVDTHGSIEAKTPEYERLAEALRG